MFQFSWCFVYTKNSNYKNSKPKKKIIELINNLYISNYIIIFTSRYMGRSNEKVSLEKKDISLQKTVERLGG